MPFYLEYYYQERLGYELNYTIFRNPFFQSPSDVPVNTQYVRGFSVHLKQKLYNKDKENGMFYYAQEARFSLNNYHAIKDSSGFTNHLQATERKYEFSFLIGDRLSKSAKNRGWSLDVFLGLGIGYREISKHYQSTPKLDGYLPGLKTSKVTFPIRFGFSLGYLLKSRSSLH
jgi:uncharacterized protein